MITTIEYTGNETDEWCHKMAWLMFCHAHPVEAYAENPEGFWLVFHETAPNVTREKMVALLKECEEDSA